ncbi:MAG: hypothetical protein JXQ96_10175 [Cyclobacteriaceae bacterium]
MKDQLEPDTLQTIIPADTVKAIQPVVQDITTFLDTTTKTTTQPYEALPKEPKAEQQSTDWLTIIVTLAIGAFLSQLFTYFTNQFSEKKKKEKRLNGVLFMMLLHVKQMIEQAKYLIEILSAYEGNLKKKKQLIEKTIASPPLNSNLFRGLDKSELFDAFGDTLLDLEQFYIHVDELKNNNPTTLQRSYMGTIEKYQSDDENHNNNIAAISLKKTLMASELYRDSAAKLIEKGEEIIKKHSPPEKQKAIEKEVDKS